MRTTSIFPVVTLALVPALASAQSAEQSAPKIWKSNIGITSVVTPSYLGSNRYQVRAFPIIDLNIKDRAYFGGSRAGVGGGFGVYVVRNETFTLSTEISGDRDRRESYGDGLAGMGKRSGGKFAGSNVSYSLGSFTAGAGVAIGLGRNDGSTASFSLGTKKVYGNRWMAGISTGATFANAENMAFDFGVTPEQAARRQALINSGDSRLYATDGRAYDPKGGLKQAQVSTSLGYLLTSRTTAIAFATGSRLGNHAADSPLVRQRNGLIAGMGLAFGI